MKFRVTRAALRPINNGMVFRNNLIVSLASLSQKGHQCSIKSDDLDPGQTALLVQESIKFSEFDPLYADVIIDANAKAIVIMDHDGEILYENEDWLEISRFILGVRRTAEKKRTTKETDISIRVDLDGSGKSTVETGIPFFDHMLEQISRHGFIDMEICCKGDLQIDEHHTIEDVAIALGECLSIALGDKRGIERYGFVLAMDESKSTVALDLSGRPYLVFDADFSREKVGDFPTEMTKHFFYSLAMGLKATINIKIEGENDHHKIESAFKGFARTLKQAVAGNYKDPDSIPSSKGTL
jgi:imidazoleglycerol phosphate dehydratase HisB